MFHPDPTIVLHSDPAAPQDHCGHKSAALPWSQAFAYKAPILTLIIYTQVKGMQHYLCLVFVPDILCISLHQLHP